MPRAASDPLAHRFGGEAGDLQTGRRPHRNRRQGGVINDVGWRGVDACQSCDQEHVFACDLGEGGREQHSEAVRRLDAGLDELLTKALEVDEEQRRTRGPTLRINEGDMDPENPLQISGVREGLRVLRVGPALREEHLLTQLFGGRLRDQHHRAAELAKMGRQRCHVVPTGVVEHSQCGARGAVPDDALFQLLEVRATGRRPGRRLGNRSSIHLSYRGTHFVEPSLASHTPPVALGDRPRLGRSPPPASPWEANTAGARAAVASSPPP